MGCSEGISEHRAHCWEGNETTKEDYGTVLKFDPVGERARRVTRGIFRSGPA